MVIDLVKKARKSWRKIVKIVSPLDSDKPVKIGSNPKSPADFEAYTDNKTITININNPKKIEDDYNKIVVPIYDKSSPVLYDISDRISKINAQELMKNLIYDVFMFVHFHEEWHPLKCPNSRYDEKTISHSLYTGIKEAQPNISKTEALFKVNNCKNLIWDVVLNVSFISETREKGNPKLEQVISQTFSDEKRRIAKADVEHYPAGILPIAYLTSAKNKTTDIPISLVGAMYSTMSFNDPDVRKKVLQVFLEDLEDKKISKAEAQKIISEMYTGFISDIEKKLLEKKGIDSEEYKKKLAIISDPNHNDYERCQSYLVNTITKIFDSPEMRYDALKGFIKPLAKYIRLDGKQGSMDNNTSSYGSGGEAAGGGASGTGGKGEKEPGEGDGSGNGKAGDSDDNDGSGSSDGDRDDDNNDGKGGKGKGKDDKGKSQGEMDSDSISQTLEDLMETLGEKEKDDILGQLGRPSHASSIGHGNGMGRPNPGVFNRLFYHSADEYYKQHSDKIEVQNPKDDKFSIDIGKLKRWKLIRSHTLTSAEAARLNYQDIMNFQRSTKLPVLMDVGNGYFKLNEYILEETPLKSYTNMKTGVEIPDNWVLIKDSSGSMTGGADYMGSGDRYDALMHVSYGVAKGLDETCKMLGKDLKFGVVDFSNNTFYSGMESFRKVFADRYDKVKELWLRPQGGGTHCSESVFSKISNDLKPGKTVYTMITDGEIDNGDSLFPKIKEIAKKKDSAFAFIEIASSSHLGAQIKELSKHNDSVIYYHVSNVKEIKDKLGSILIKYN